MNRQDRALTRGELLLDDQIQNFAGHEDYALKCFAGEMWAGIGIRLSGGERGGLIGTDRKEEFGAFLAVYLNDNLGLGGNEFGCVEGWPCGSNDRSAGA